MEDTQAQSEKQEVPRVLAIRHAGPSLRLLRETLGNLTTAEVDTTPDALYGFELALQRRYALYIFSLDLPVIDGPLLYEMISKAHTFAHGEARVAPGVLYLADDNLATHRANFARDARVKGVLSLPLKIDRLLEAVDGTLERRDQFGQGGLQEPS